MASISPSNPGGSIFRRGSELLRRLAGGARRSLARLLRHEAASGLVLLAAAAVAFLAASSPWSAAYTALWHTPLGGRVGALAFERPLEWYVNDGLMVLFFFVVGLEIRRELYHGALSERRRAALPVVAAIGGMVVPAALYLCFAGGAGTRAGWGVPMATDIAFAVGVLSLLGKRVPPALRVLLLALAVIDDLGAIVAIALFYSSGLSLPGLLVALAGFAGVHVMKRWGVRAKLLYVLPAVVAWAGTYAAGIHPTIAGVVLGLMTPVQARGETLPPAEHLLDVLRPWVAFGIMPLFALANAGVVVSGVDFTASAWSVATGVAVGLVLGKPVGVLLASALVLRLRVAALPEGLGPRHLVVLALIAGIGFTMSLFIATLAFTDPVLLAAAKLGVLVASAAAAVGGLALGHVLLAPRTSSPGAPLAAAARQW